MAQQKRRRGQHFTIQGFSVLSGALVEFIRQSPGTGSCTVELVTDYGPYKKGERVNVASYDLVSLSGNNVGETTQVVSLREEIITPVKAAALLAKPGEGIEEALERVEKSNPPTAS